MTDLTRLSVDELAEKCEKETRRFQKERQQPTKGDSSCWELVRRAIVERDSLAWEAVYEQYKRLIGKWGTGVDLDLDDFVQKFFVRILLANYEPDFATRFPTIGAVMGFWKQCAYNLAIDIERRLNRPGAAALPSRGSQIRSIEESIFLAEAIVFLKEQLSDDAELLAFELSWVLGLERPSLIADVCSCWVDKYKQEQGKNEPDAGLEHFWANFDVAGHLGWEEKRVIQACEKLSDTQSVYRFKEYILRRLRRNPHVQSWLKQDKSNLGNEKA